MHHISSFLFLVLLLSNMRGHAQEWTGAVNTDWNNQANWNDWPLTDEDITIDPAFYTGAMASPVIAFNSTFVPDRLFIQNGAVLVIDANLTVADRTIIGADAEVMMNSGTLVTGRLIAEEGGTFTLEDGTVNALGVVALGDDGTAPSRMIINGGTMNATGEFGFDIELGPSDPLFIVNEGSLVVNGDVIWFGAAPGSGRGRLQVNGGTVQINGSLANTISSTVDLYVNITGGSLTMNGPLIELAHATDSIVLSGGNMHIEANTLVRNDGVFHADESVITVHDQTELRGVGTYQFHHLSIATGATLEHTDPAVISVAGNWNNLGSFQPDVNTVSFNGSQVQEIAGTSFHGLHINNISGGIQLTGHSSVAGTLELENGIVQSGSDPMLEILDDATAAGGSSLSHVDGSMRKTGDDDFVFPVGDNGILGRIGISGLSDPAAEYTVRYFNSPYTNTTSLGPAMIGVSAVEHWSLQRGATNDDAQVTLFWEDAAASGLASCDDLVVAFWNGSAWQGMAGEITGNCTGSSAGNVASDGGAPVYDVFTLGTSDGTVGIEALTNSLVPVLAHDAAMGTLRASGIDGSATLFVLDARGAMIMQHTIRQDEQMIGLPALAPGLYHAHLQTPGSTAYHRFVIAGR